MKGMIKRMRLLGNYHLSTAIAVIMLSVFTVLLGGCSSSEESTPSKKSVKPTQVSSVPTKAPVAKVDASSDQVKKEASQKPAPATEADGLLKKIANEKDLFALYDMKTQYEQGKDKAESVLAALVKKQDELIAQQKRQAAINGCLDFVAFDFKKVKGETHRLRCYYIVTQDIKTDWIFKAGLEVDKKFVNLLPEKNQETGVVFCQIPVARSQITTWKKGEHKVLSVDVNLKPTSYDIRTVFYQWFPDKPQVYANSIHNGLCVVKE